MSGWQRLQKESAHKTRLELRAKITRNVREFFWSKDFIELETPLLVALPGQEPYLHPFRTSVIEPNGIEYNGYLITSPEYGLKKMLAGGFTRIFQLGKTFRNREDFGGLHNPEFKMIEWYRAHKDYTAIMDDTELLTRFCAEQLEMGGHHVPFNYKDPWERVSMRELWQKHVGVDLDELKTVESLTVLAKSRGFQIQEGEPYEDVFFRIFLNEIERKLGREVPTIVYDYPVALSSLARLKASDPSYAERIEVYINGIEIANGFSELIVPDEQHARLEEEQMLRKKLGHDVFPIDEDFIEALLKMPPSAGIALGIDRLVMALLGVSRIEDILAIPAKEMFN